MIHPPLIELIYGLLGKGNTALNEIMKDNVAFYAIWFAELLGWVSIFGFIMALYYSIDEFFANEIVFTGHVVEKIYSPASFRYPEQYILLVTLYGKTRRVNCSVDFYISCKIGDEIRYKQRQGKFSGRQVGENIPI